MGTKTVRLDEDTYERIKSKKRADETFSEAIDRLIGGYSLLDFAGGLSEEEADRMRAAIDEANEEYAESISEEFDQ
jgi:predicted CopG family antitoxin